MESMGPSTAELDGMRSRLRLLLDTHRQQLSPTVLHPKPGAIVIRQGQPAESLLLVNKGSLVVELQEPGQPLRTLAVVKQGDLLGEMALFGDGHHTAQVRVLEGPAELLSIARDALLQAVLFDSELTAELLHVSTKRCQRSNQWVTLLLDGINACAAGDIDTLNKVSEQLQQGPDSMKTAAEQLLALTETPKPDRLR